MDNVSFFELDTSYRLISFNQKFMNDIKLHENDLIGKTAQEILPKKAFHHMYDLGNQEAILSKGISIRKDIALFYDGCQPIITTKNILTITMYIFAVFIFLLRKVQPRYVGKKL